MSRIIINHCLFLLFSLAFAAVAQAWGERGHDLIARASVRIMLARSQQNPTIKAVFGAKEHMLGHLANVPDIVWRGVNNDTDQLGAPTHYIDVEYLDHKSSVSSFPKTLDDAEVSIANFCRTSDAAEFCKPKSPKQSRVAAAGTAPWRLTQFFNRMVSALKRGQIDEALLNAGVMAHFVGDLANPHHTTVDYDGFFTNQGGIHAYFESELVASYDLDLDQEVLKHALDQKPFATMQKKLSFAANDAFAVAVALTLNSHQRLAEVNALDRKHAIKRPSSTAKGMRIKAERRDAADVNPAFRAIIVERLALAADTLAHLWTSAWQAAGSPVLAHYQSYVYAVAPEFVPPDYLTHPAKRQ